MPLTPDADLRFIGDSAYCDKCEALKEITKIYDLVELALARERYKIVPTAECAATGSASDAPSQLAMFDEKIPGYFGFWGLYRKMTLREALEDFDYFEHDFTWEGDKYSGMRDERGQHVALV